MKSEFTTLTAGAIKTAIKNGTARCTWNCVDAEGNEPHGGVGLFVTANNNYGFNYMPIIGDDLNDGGITFDGFFWFADYDNGVSAQFGDEKERTLQIFVSNDALDEILIDEGLDIICDAEMRATISAKDAAKIPEIIDRRASAAFGDFAFENIEEAEL